MRYFLIACFTILTVLCIIDSYSTYLILQGGGKEINPVMNWLMDKFGTTNALVFPKLICLLILYHGTFKAIKIPLSNRKMRFVAGAYIVLICLYVVVVFKLNMPFLNTL